MSGFDGGGTYVRNYNWTQDAANGIPITASRFDAEHNGFASGLSNCITRDGQGKPVADISWNNHKIITLADPSLPQDAVTLAFLNSNSGLLNLLSTRVKYDITPAETAASVTPVNYYIAPGDVRGSVLRYGAVCDGVTNDAAAIQNAFNVKGLVTFPPNSSIKVNSSLSIDASTTRVVGNGSTIISGLASGYLFNIGATGGGQTVTKNPISGLRLVGNSTVGVTAMNFEAVGLLGGFDVNEVSFEYFDTDVRIYTNAFCINFNGCSFSQNIGSNITVPGGGSGYGEKITFNHCFFFNNARCAYSTYNACQLFFVNCSLDYSYKICEVNQGRAYFSNCYSENSFDTQYWFITGTTESCYIKWHGGLISMTGAKTTAFASAGSGSTIEFSDVNLYAGSNSVGDDFIGVGAGTTYARNCRIIGFAQSYRGWAGPSAAQSICSNGAFVTDLGGWTVAATGGSNVPVRDATGGAAGGPAMKFNTNIAATQSSAYWEIAAAPGDNVGVRLNVKSANVNAAIYWILQCLGNDNIVIGTPDLVYGWNRFDATTPAADTSFHTHRLSTPNGCPPGTTKVRLLIVSDYSSGYAVWIDGAKPLVLTKY